MALGLNGQAETLILLFAQSKLRLEDTVQWAPVQWAYAAFVCPAPLLLGETFPLLFQMVITELPQPLLGSGYNGPHH